MFIDPKNVSIFIFSLYSKDDCSIRFQFCNGRPQMLVKELTTLLTLIKNLNSSTYFVTHLGQNNLSKKREMNNMMGQYLKIIWLDKFWPVSRKNALERSTFYLGFLQSHQLTWSLSECGDWTFPLLEGKKFYSIPIIPRRCLPS